MKTNRWQTPVLPGAEFSMMEKSNAQKPYWLGLQWAGGFSLPIPLLVALVNCVDILASRRSSYANFHWSCIHVFAVKIQDYGLLIKKSSYLPFALEWVTATIIVCFLSQRVFTTKAMHRKCVIAFIVGFPIVSIIVSWIAVGFIFFVAVLKFGFAWCAKRIVLFPGTPIKDITSYLVGGRTPFRVLPEPLGRWWLIVVLIRLFWEEAPKRVKPL